MPEETASPVPVTIVQSKGFFIDLSLSLREKKYKHLRVKSDYKTWTGGEYGLRLLLVMS